ncbi:MAG: hypothetical protein IPJ74_27410 [Saprospiraceae bacterium]|nr:hypothetical protein [Saprospiraceae bacterium]
MLDQYQVKAIRAIGTAALRTASNWQDFIDQVKTLASIEVQLITGDREAELIHKGVMLAIPPVQERMLIMDIGGGSVEFIIADCQQVYWAQSFSCGCGCIVEKFSQKRSDYASRNRSGTSVPSPIFTAFVRCFEAISYANFGGCFGYV